MQIIAFNSDDIANVFAKLSPKELDDIPFGVVQVDGTGQILLFNAAEGILAGYDPKMAIGKNFFTDVAPCASEIGFRDKFDKGVKAGNLNVLFEWHLAGSNMPTIQVHLKKAVETSKFWIFTK